jgi:hypothetical protein
MIPRPSSELQSEARTAGQKVSKGLLTERQTCEVLSALVEELAARLFEVERELEKLKRTTR